MKMVSRQNVVRPLRCQRDHLGQGKVGRKSRIGASRQEVPHPVVDLTTREWQSRVNFGCTVQRECSV